MNEPTEPQTDLRSEPERFEDALRTMFTTPKEKVTAKLAAEKEARQKEREVKPTIPQK